MIGPDTKSLPVISSRCKVHFAVGSVGISFFQNLIHFGPADATDRMRYVHVIGRNDKPFAAQKDSFLEGARWQQG